MTKAPETLIVDHAERIKPLQPCIIFRKARHVINRMDIEVSENNQRPRRGRARIGELGPAWITAIAALIVALTGAGFFAGRVTAGPTKTVAPPASHSETYPASPAVTQSEQPSSVASSGGITYLSQLTPLQKAVYSFTTEPVQMGATTFQQSIRFTCQTAITSFFYNVTGFTFLDATVGVPNNAANPAGYTANISFFKNGSTTQLGPTITDVLGQLQKVHLNLEGAVQLQVACTTAADGPDTFMDIALGNPSLSGSLR